MLFARAEASEPLLVIVLQSLPLEVPFVKPLNWLIAFPRIVGFEEKVADFLRGDSFAHHHHHHEPAVWNSFDYRPIYIYFIATKR